MRTEHLDIAISAVSSAVVERVTWDTRLPVNDPERMMAVLRAAGLPLADTQPNEGESIQSQQVCVAAVREGEIHAFVATPSGLVYRFEPAVFELSFWAFAARHYYWVTFSIGDRVHVSTLTGVPITIMKGRSLSRTRTGLSNVTLNALMGKLTATAEASPSPSSPPL